YRESHFSQDGVGSQAVLAVGQSQELRVGRPAQSILQGSQITSRCKAVMSPQDCILQPCDSRCICQAQIAGWNQVGRSQTEKSRIRLPLHQIMQPNQECLVLCLAGIQER